MALVPKNFKFMKYKKGRISPSIHRKKNISFGQIALKAKESGRLTSKQIEAARRYIKKKIKPFGGIVKTRLKLVLPVTAKPLTVRMGRSKGRVSLHVSPVKAGQILYEIYCLSSEEAKKAAAGAIHKLPIDVKIYVSTRKIF
jgi:large subunit ribosomal protein L16